MDSYSPNKLFAIKYCFLILGDEFLFLNHFLIFRVFLNIFLFYFILLLLIFTKSILLLSFYLIIFFFMKITLIFSCSGMFRHVPECSGMFRDVPCSGFYRRPLWGRQWVSQSNIWPGWQGNNIPLSIFLRFLVSTFKSFLGFREFSPVSRPFFQAGAGT